MARGQLALAQNTLPHLPTGISIPRYDRTRVRAGIAHIGVGNFHRAHQALYIDRCLHLPRHEHWGIVGIGLGIGNSAAQKGAAFRRQDGLYTLTEYSPDGTTSRHVIGSLVDYLHAPDDPGAVLDRLADPAIRIVSLTITEGGYNIVEATGEFDASSPDVAHDLANPGRPRTAFGFIVEALARRRAGGLGPFTVMTCDNLRHNGDIARKSFLAFANARDPDLALWIDENVTFPNSMIDRITPITTEADRRRLNEASSVDDALPVMAEDFIQWVMEDRFCAGRPDFPAVGIELRDDVRDHEAVKGRMLNASHMTLVFPALLLGYREVHHAMTDARLIRLLDLYMTKDSMPLLKAPAGVDLGEYKRMVLRRFSNPAVGDQLLRIAGNGAVKLPTFLFKTLTGCLAQGHDIRRFALVFASFRRYLLGSDEAGNTYQIDEPHMTAAEIAAARSSDPLQVLKQATFASVDMAGSAVFSKEYVEYARMIHSVGAAAALEAATSGSGNS